MEVAGVVVRPVINIYGAGVDAQVSNSSPSRRLVVPSKKKSGNLCLGIGNSRVIMMAVRTRSFAALSSSGFADTGHLEYYVSAKKNKEKEKEKEKEMEMEMEKEKSCEVKKVKKKLKLIKRLSRDMSMVSDMASTGVETENSLVGEVKGKMISEAMEFLLAQLQQMKTEQKELKRKKKAEMKAKCKSDSSSSSSSESSDSECGEVIDMSCLRSRGSKQSKDNDPEQLVEEATLVISSSPVEGVNSKEGVGNGESSLQIIGEECCTGTASSSNSCSSSRNVAVRAMASSEQRVEVCIGGKCKKMGAMTLLEEFEKKVGEEGAVVGCKCMGRCKNGPNVRLKNHPDEIQAERGEGSFKFQSNPLYIGVTIEDVGDVVATFLDKQSNDKCMVAPA